MVFFNMNQIKSSTIQNAKTKIIVFAALTRVIAILIQIIANLIIPDHDANVFTYPKFNLTNSFYDNAITVALGGFVRWDAQYFMHIAKYGYTYENTLAFFPLYPLSVKAISFVLGYLFIFLNEDSVLLLTFILFNWYLFIKTAIALYELSLIILNDNLAYKSAILFCINPATIFFVAPYSECLFCYLTFKAALYCFLIFNKNSKCENNFNFKNLIKIIIPLSLSTSVRSNGILNVGFISYLTIQHLVEHIYLSKSLKSFRDQFVAILKYGIFLLVIIAICLIPFTLVQIYDYYQYCTDYPNNLSEDIINFGLANNFVLPGQVSTNKQSWCFKKLPLAYSYVQDHYWNVGFLRYFEFKQIPNFLLAFPVIYLIIVNSITFFKLHKTYCLNLGIFRFYSSFNTKQKGSDYFKKEMFVFIVHALFLTIFCTLSIHVQVTTRMICSASPIVYWFAAYYFENVKEDGSSLKYMFLFSKNRNNYARYVTYYFLIYFIVGIVMFCNFLPWT